MAPRPKKQRQSRMHAAIDAMRPYGFSPKTVQAKVKALLKEYGGDDNWPFIETDAYSLLISSILEEQEEENKREKSDVGENLMVAKLDSGIRSYESAGSDAGPSELALSSVGSETMDTASHTMLTVDQSKETMLIHPMKSSLYRHSLDPSSVGNVKKESSESKVLETSPITSQPLNIPTLQLVRTLQPKSENLNGWLIEDDDDNGSELQKFNQDIKTSSLKRKHSNP